MDHQIKSQPLPDCMMPDGAEPCAGFRHEADHRTALGGRCRALENALNRLGDELDGLLGKYELPHTMPIGWSETDFERIADWVEPMRREIQRLRELAYDAIGPVSNSQTDASQ